MNIAIVTINQENAAIASWLAAQDFSGCTLAHWQIEPQPVVAEQVLDALVEQWQRTPADVVLFPPGTFGDELSTRLAWRLHGASICQVTSLDIPTVTFNRNRPKHELWEQLNRMFKEDIPSYRLDLEWSLNIPVAYRSIGACAKLEVAMNSGIDSTLKDLPPKHVYLVEGDENDYLVEIVFDDN